MKKNPLWGKLLLSTIISGTLAISQSAHANIGTQISSAGRTPTQAWVVNNIKEYQMEVVDETAVIGNNVPANQNPTSNLGSLTMLSEISKVFKEGGGVSVPRGAKLSSTALKMPNSIAGTIKDGLESVVSLNEVLEARNKASQTNATAQLAKIDSLMTKMANEYNPNSELYPENPSVLRKFKTELEGIKLPGERSNLYQKITTDINSRNLSQYQPLASKLDTVVAQYKGETNYRVSKKVSSYSSSAKPKVKFIKVAKGVTGILGSVGDLISFALDIATMFATEPNQYVYVGAAAENQTTTTRYASSIIKEMAAINGAVLSYNARANALKDAVKELNPIFIHGRTAPVVESRWTNLLWILNEKSLQDNINSGNILFGDYARNGTRTKWYPENLPDTVKPLSSELHFTKYAVQQSSTLVAMLGGIESGIDYDPRAKNSVAKNAFDHYTSSMLIEIDSMPAEERFSWSLTKYLDKVDELKVAARQFQVYSQLYKGAVLLALYEAANPNLVNKTRSGYFNITTYDVNVTISKTDDIREWYNAYSNDNGRFRGGVYTPDQMVTQLTNAVSALTEHVMDNHLLNASQDKVLNTILATIQQQANTEVTGPNAQDSWYQLFQKPNESSSQNNTRLVKLFNNSLDALLTDFDQAAIESKVQVASTETAAETLALNWMNSDVFKLAGKYYTPLGAMDQIVFEASTGGRTDSFAAQRVINTVGTDVYAHDSFFDVLNHSIYRNFLNKHDPRYPHFRGWDGIKLNGEIPDDDSYVGNRDNQPGWVRVADGPGFLYIDMSENKYVNNAVMPIRWRWSIGTNRRNTPDIVATFGMPLPTKSNLNTIGEVSAYVIMSKLGGAISHFDNVNNVTNLNDSAASIHDYKYISPTNNMDTKTKSFTWND